MAAFFPSESEIVETLKAEMLEGFNEFVDRAMFMESPEMWLLIYPDWKPTKGWWDIDEDDAPDSFTAVQALYEKVTNHE